MGVQGESRHLPLAVVQDAEVLAVGCKGRGQPFALPAEADQAQAGRWVQGERSLPGRPAYLPGRNPGGPRGMGNPPARCAR